MNGFLARPSAAWIAGAVAVSGSLTLGFMGGATADPPEHGVVAVSPMSTATRPPSGVVAPSLAATTAGARPSVTPSPTPTLKVSPSSTSPSAPTAQSLTPGAASSGSALDAVASLTVKGRASKAGYSRQQFGQVWFDADRNGCDTRNDVLRRDLVDREMKNSCKVLAGTRRPDPYTGTMVHYVTGGASEIDVDHVVALGDAWQKGAAAWKPEKRLAFANDPLNLLAVASGSNRSKGDGDVATWLPPSKAYRCAYVARVVAIKLKYQVWVTAAERDAVVRVLSGCLPVPPLPEPGPAPTTAALPASAATAGPEPTAEVPITKTGGATVYYKNCDAVRAAGAAPILVGDPGYASHLDGDRDGVGCER